MTGIVIAWHTPDEKYTAVANNLRSQLDVYDQEYKIYTIEKATPDESWTDVITRTKTNLWRRAMKEYPHKPLLFLDVDCHINGLVGPLFDTMQSCDMGISFRSKDRGSKLRNFFMSTRVFLINPTQGAREFMEKWEEVSKGNPYGDEESSIKVLFATQDFDAIIKKIPNRYAGWEVSRAPADFIITHDSAHKEDGPRKKRIEQSVRALYRTIWPKVVLQ